MKLGLTIKRVLTKSTKVATADGKRKTLRTYDITITPLFKTEAVLTLSESI